MRIVFTVEVEVERTSGKFAGKEEIADWIVGWLNDANETLVTGVGADGESEYEVTGWDVISP